MYKCHFFVPKYDGSLLRLVIFRHPKHWNLLIDGIGEALWAIRHRTSMPFYKLIQ